jgi:hypothetical protein
MENINNVTAILRSPHTSALSISDSIGTFGNVVSGDSSQNTSDYFTIHASSQISIGHKFYLKLILRSGTYERTLEFPVTIGVVSSNSPIGPDYYGYYCYDNTDISYAECPSYNWTEIDPAYGGSGTRINLSNDAIRTINLPFTFRYYGRTFNKISVCSNGYITMDSSALVDMYNWNIPSSLGPPALIAPMWDDFHPDTLSASGVYYYYDATNNRFIIEWSRVYHIHGFMDPTLAELQTFQVILYNQAYYPTRTNDGPIIFQYNTIANDDTAWSNCHNAATVGIENYEQTDGIEYTFAGSYHQGAATLINSRAIKFTTNRPDTFTAINEPAINSLILPSQIILKVSPNPIRQQSQISYSVPHSSFVTIKLFDALGRNVKNLFEGEKQSGNYQISLSTKDLSKGIYYILLTANINHNIIRSKTKIAIY